MYKTQRQWANLWKAARHNIFFLFTETATEYKNQVRVTMLETLPHVEEVQMLQFRDSFH